MSSVEENEEKKEQELRLAFSHILQGYSDVRIEPPVHSSMYNPSRKVIECYAKHFNFFDQIHLDNLYQASFNKAKSNGLPTRQERLDALDASGDWTKADEKKYINQKAFLSNLYETKAKMLIPAQADAVQRNIDAGEDEVKAMESERLALVGQVCENYANSQLNTSTMTYILYSDKDCTKPLFSEDDIEYIDNSDIAVLVEAYNEAVKLLSIGNIKRLSIASFFTSYFALVEETPHVFFSKKEVYELSFYQLNLLSYAKVLRSIIRNTQPPKHIVDNPDRLLEWSEKGEKARQKIEKARDGDDNYTVVGAKREDYEEMGVSQEGADIFSASKKKGKGGQYGGAGSGSAEGEMSIMDFID
jgi:hypothetical protein